jgi:ribonuclease E
VRPGEVAAAEIASPPTNGAGLASAGRASAGRHGGTAAGGAERRAGARAPEEGAEAKGEGRGRRRRRRGGRGRRSAGAEAPLESAGSTDSAVATVPEPEGDRASGMRAPEQAREWSPPAEASSGRAEAPSEVTATAPGAGLASTWLVAAPVSPAPVAPAPALPQPRVLEERAPAAGAFGVRPDEARLETADTREPERDAADSGAAIASWQDPGHPYPAWPPGGETATPGVASPIEGAPEAGAGELPVPDDGVRPAPPPARRRRRRGGKRGGRGRRTSHAAGLEQGAPAAEPAEGDGAPEREAGGEGPGGAGEGGSRRRRGGSRRRRSRVGTLGAPASPLEPPPES